MGYKCGTSTTLSGTTTDTGEFTCPVGQTVAFYVGDILVGSVASATAVVTPLDLVGANASPTNVTVTNIVRFLMSLSTTAPSGGTITLDPAAIAAAAGQMIDFAATTTTALDTMITTLRPTATVYTNAQATAHVTLSINELFAGNYSGTYSGAQSGSWSLTIAADGSVTGTSDAGAITGSMATTISTGSTYAFTGTAGTVPWVGTLNVSTKVFSGTWDGGAPNGGTFTGTTSTPTGGGGASGTLTITSATPAVHNGTVDMGAASLMANTALNTQDGTPYCDITYFADSNTGSPYEVKVYFRQSDQKVLNAGLI
jgi:hypothetical protein